MKIELRSLLDRLDEAGLILERQGPVDGIWVDHLANDSRKVAAGGLFVAIRGKLSDGHLFIDKAVQNGAVAIVYEAAPEEKWSQNTSGVALVRVTNARAAMAELSAAFYGDPSKRLRMIGITGTNGKTTTTYLVHHLLTVLGVKAGLMGTVAILAGDKPVDASLTTPDALELNRTLKKMVEAGCTACVMEVSSHALHQDRVRGIPYQVAVFTNLTNDHLDYHGTIEAYRQAKKILFDSLSPDAVAVYNVDDPTGITIVSDTRAQTISYGRSEKAEVRLEVLADSIDGLHLRIDGIERKFRLVGLFNAYNLAAAYGVGRALGYSPEVILEALATAPPVPGRFEQVRFADGTTVVIDYAHTPDALENVLATLVRTKPDNAALWCLFGCGGDRDATKRPTMGRIAERYADRVIVTSDNPRTEDPLAIMEDIRTGMEHPGNAMWIANRREAIHQAAELAAPGDVILVAGKGHETYQIIGTERIPFDDHEEVRQSFFSRGLIETH